MNKILRTNLFCKALYYISWRQSDIVILLWIIRPSSLMTYVLLARHCLHAVVSFTSYHSRVKSRTKTRRNSLRVSSLFFQRRNNFLHHFLTRLLQLEINDL